jgi:hypothetical protein
MARIKQADHPRILRMVEVDRHRVPDVAAEYGCTPGTIYALLAKLRRRPAEGPPQSGPAQPPLALDPGQPLAGAGLAVHDCEKAAALADAPQPLAPAAEPSDHPRQSGPEAAALCAEGDPNAPASDQTPAGPDTESNPPRTAFTAAGASRSLEPTTRVETVHRRAAGSGPATVGARLAKPGFGLLMRTADGEETLAPFRSLEDLLSAIKPILRASANSSDPVWFSLQPVDLATIEDADAA